MGTRHFTFGIGLPRTSHTPANSGFPLDLLLGKIRAMLDAVGQDIADQVIASLEDRFLRGGEEKSLQRRGEAAKIDESLIDVGPGKSDLTKGSKETIAKGNTTEDRNLERDLSSLRNLKQ